MPHEREDMRSVLAMELLETIGGLPEDVKMDKKHRRGMAKEIALESGPGAARGKAPLLGARPSCLIRCPTWLPMPQCLWNSDRVP